LIHDSSITEKELDPKYIRMASRRAWNEAMKNAATGTGLKLPDPITRRGRSSNRSKRRDKARKTNVSLINGNDDDDDDGLEYRNAIRLDFLEGAMIDDDVDDVEEEYDELEDMEESTGGGGTSGKKRKRGNSSKRKKKAPAGSIPKRFKAKSLASILIEESSRTDGITNKYVNAEARPMKGQPRYPTMKICPVTGLEGVYTDPKNGIPYANLKALEQIRERMPPWISGTQGGSSAYHDAVKSLRNEE
jgi:hypothetical protein